MIPALLRSPDWPIGDFDIDDDDNVGGEVGGEVEVVTVEEDASVGKLNGDDVLCDGDDVLGDGDDTLGDGDDTLGDGDDVLGDGDGDGDADVDVKIEGETEGVEEETTFGEIIGDALLGDSDVVNHEIIGGIEGDEGWLDENNGDAALGCDDFGIGIENEGEADNDSGDAALGCDDFDVETVGEEVIERKLGTEIVGDGVWAEGVDGNLDRSEGDKEDLGGKKGDFEGFGEGLRVGEPIDSTEQSLLVSGAQIDTLQDIRVSEALLLLVSIPFNFFYPLTWRRRTMSRICVTLRIWRRDENQAIYRNVEQAC